MTAIVGYSSNGTVYMGGDSAGTHDDCDRYIITEKKVFQNGPLLIGYTTSFRMGQLLQYRLNIPVRSENITDMEYMVVHVIEAIMECLKVGGYSTVENNEEVGGEFLIGYKGKIYHVESDYHVYVSRLPFDACGLGDKYALGALKRDMDEGIQNSKAMVLSALECAATFNAAVAPPFYVEHLD